MTRLQSHDTTILLRRIERQVERARIDYMQHYTSLYIAYNTWYRRVTGAANDRTAITALKRRFVLWQDYEEGRCMRQLGPIAARIAEVTQREPLSTSPLVRWRGEVADAYDWRSLIEYWYQVRCLIVHGEPLDAKHAYLAYSSLLVFLGEVQKRAAECKEGSVWSVDMYSAASTPLLTDKNTVY